MDIKKRAPYFLASDYLDIEAEQTFEDLRKIALRILGCMPQPVAMVCGPISTGGKGSIPENLKVFHEAIDKLTSEGVMIFSQMPFEDRIQELKAKKEYYRGDNHLMEVFYGPIFSSGLIRTFYFIFYTWLEVV